MRERRQAITCSQFEIDFDNFINQEINRWLLWEDVFFSLNGNKVNWRQSMWYDLIELWLKFEQRPLRILLVWIRIERFWYTDRVYTHWLRTTLTKWRHLLEMYSVWNGNQLWYRCALEYCCHFNNRSSCIRQLVLRICPFIIIISIGIFFPVAILFIESRSNGIQTRQISTQRTEQVAWSC